MHDECVDRTTNGRGRVKELTWGEMRRLDAGSWKSAKFAGEPVPRLDDVLAETAGKTILHIEVKEPGIEQQVVDIVKEAGALEWTLLTSFHPEVIKRVGSIEPMIPRSLIVGWLNIPEELRRGEPVRWATGCGANALALYKGRATDALIAHAHQRLLSVAVWTVNDTAEAQEIMKMGADAIVTDYPDIMLNYLRKR